MLNDKKLDVIYILSEKSSGSSFLFRSLKDALSLKNYPKTHHFESETLYWTKAASLLKKPQIKMLASAVPYEEIRARNEIKAFLEKNLTQPLSYETDEELVFNGWYALVQEFGPVFIEKSPHHLLQWSALELMIEFERRFSDQVNCHYICIVRNPKDVFMSQLRRWNVSPERLENQWLITNFNWMRFSELPTTVSDKILIRYEDLISDTKSTIKHICQKFGISESFHGNEVAKTSKSAKHNALFGYQFSASVVMVAKSQGYSANEVQGNTCYQWRIYRLYISLFYSPLKVVFQKIKRVLR
jgi:hypothetical protein